MKPVDILMICIDSTAGVMNGLCDAINKYTPYHARFVRVKDNWLGYPADLTFQDDKDKLPEILKEVQVIHWNIHSQKNYEKWFKFKEHDLSDKIHVRHFHGTTLRRSGNLEQNNDYKKVFVSTPDLLQYCKNINNAAWLPNPIYIPYDIKTSFPELMTILHMPSTGNRYSKYQDIIKNLDFYPTDYPPQSIVKGTDIFHKAMWDLRKEHAPITHKIPGHVTFEESLKLKGNCSIYFDMLWSGLYGCSAIESMYLKKPVMCRISKDTETKMKDLWLDEELPFLNVGYKDLKNDILKYINIDVEQVGKESYEWVTKAHSPEKIAKFYCEEVGL